MQKAIIVTGGSRGIGKATLEKFANKGYVLITCGRNEKDLIELKDYFLKKYTDTKLHAVVADLATRAGAGFFVDEFNKLNLEPLVLVNNVGYYIPGQIHNEPEGALEEMININLYSTYHVTRGIVPKMIKSRKGHIFNICSTASIMPYVNGGAYCVSKYAVYGMTQVLREEMKQHQVKVTAILPGATFTSSWEGTDLPTERLMKPEDVAEVIYASFLLSDSAVVESVLIRPQLGDIV